MTMQIKTGDRVKFCDKIVRVLKCGNGTSDPSFRLSHSPYCRLYPIQ